MTATLTASLLAGPIDSLRAAARRKRGGIRIEIPTAIGSNDGEVLVCFAQGRTMVACVVEAPSGGAWSPWLEMFREVISRAIARSARLPCESKLSSAEESLLRRGGFDLDERPSESSPMVAAAAEFTELLANSLTTAEAARRLGVNTSRVRQRLTASRPSLYGIKTSAGWRLPRFQFRKRSLMPGIDQVIRRLSPELHPVAVQRWLSSPSVDLEIDGRQCSPLEWLAVGAPLQSLVELAAVV